MLTFALHLTSEIQLRPVLQQSRNMMKKQILLSFCLTISILSASAQEWVSPSNPLKNSYSGQEFIPLADSLHNSLWDTTTNEFKLKSRAFFSYDPGGQLLENYSKTLDKSGTSWNNYSRYAYSYIGSLTTQVTFQQWDKAASAWKNNWMQLYYYDESNMLQGYIVQNYNLTDSTWEYSTKFSYTYDGNKVTQTLVQGWNDNLNTWVNSNRYTNTYSGSNLTVIQLEMWDISGSQWKPYSRTTITYSGSKEMQRLTENYDQETSAWYNTTRIDITYGTASGLKETETEVHWNSSAWVNAVNTVYTYNNGNLKTTTIQEWAAHLNAWRNRNLGEYYYSDHEVHGIGEVATEKPLLPNPIQAGQSFRLTGLDENSQYYIEMSSVTGAFCGSWQTTGNGMITILPALRPGLYIVHARVQGKTSYYQKVLVTR
jgi:hypothetical protein